MVHESDPYIVVLTSVQSIIANPYRVIINIRTTYNTTSVFSTSKRPYFVN